jgi:hypothetical protein
MVAYTVRCRFDDPQIAEEWLAWLRSEHLADVCQAGATEARAVRLDGEPITCEARYIFPSRASFERYERDHAPRLRQEGLARFPLARGLHYERTVGEVIDEQRTA